MGTGLGRSPLLLGPVSAGASGARPDDNRRVSLGRPSVETSAGTKMTTLIYWFRSDLRLHDNPALRRACATASRLLPLFIHDASLEASTRWGFRRQGVHRRRFLDATVASLDHELQSHGSRLAVMHGSPVEILIRLAKESGAAGIVCETIAAPEEEAQIRAIRSAGIRIETVWQSMLLPTARLPFPEAEVPDVFTNFRQVVERGRIRPETPYPAPDFIPPLPEQSLPTAPALPTTAPALPTTSPAATPLPLAPVREPAVEDTRSSFPYWRPSHAGGERAALAHLERYFDSDLPGRYKQTRNQLTGLDYSTKFSPWLATGALSPRRIHEALARHEALRGGSDGSYWIWFELLWRDHFRLLHLKHGSHLYCATGLRMTQRRDSVPMDRRHSEPATTRAFSNWCEGRTGEPIVDAGMRELFATGYLSNRLRQVVASFLIHDLNGDWRAGAAWFESCLIDYDVYSNQGNWLYIAGLGTDPRGGRRFDPAKQAREHDPEGAYRALWGCA